MGKIKNILLGLAMVLGLSSCVGYEGTVEIGTTPVYYYSPYRYVYRPAPVYHHRPTPPPPPTRHMGPTPKPHHPGTSRGNGGPRNHRPSGGRR